MGRLYQRWEEDECANCGSTFHVARTEPKFVEIPICGDCEIYADAERQSSEEIDRLRARVAELEAEKAELVKDRERLRDLVRDAWVECYVHTALDDVKTDPMCLAGLEMEAIEDWNESITKSRIDAAREAADD